MKSPKWYRKKKKRSHVRQNIVCRRKRQDIIKKNIAAKLRHTTLSLHLWNLNITDIPIHTSGTIFLLECATVSFLRIYCLLRWTVYIARLKIVTLWFCFCLIWKKFVSRNCEGFSRNWMLVLIRLGLLKLVAVESFIVSEKDFWRKILIIYTNWNLNWFELYIYIGRYYKYLNRRIFTRIEMESCFKVRFLVGFLS